MTYDLLLAGDLDASELAVALAAMTSVPLEAVDVAQKNSTERRWDATVLCGYEQRGGDVPWMLDVYVTEDAPSAPDVGEAAAFLAQRLDVPVLYEAEGGLPSAYWLMDPRGLRTRARVYDDDEETSLEMTIDAVEQPVPALPDVRVEAQPEVIREHRMPTPLTDELKGSLRAHASADGVVRLALNRLAGWESFVARMTAGWPPDGWYPADFYRQNLELRDELERALEDLPDTAAALFRTAVSKVDETFKKGTHEVSEVGWVSTALRRATLPETWWWWRLPAVEPWLNEPGRSS